MHAANLLRSSTAHTDHEPVFLSRRGRRVAAIIDAGDLERLIELAEDMSKFARPRNRAKRCAKRESEPIPWEEVKADLGLV
ncbi:type II toxin-antitoxin system prevent-host-death family antitoxin [Arthrobacter sp. A5]|uniref:type II toxin-antitoxin system prevent-host-death family antitoxin n=1 Tax=Arthrobacter sp. A5 TaxID=576926 RepID=UPI003DA87F42